MQGLPAREQTAQGEERRFDDAGRNTMRRESKRFSGTAIRYVGEVQTPAEAAGRASVDRSALTIIRVGDAKRGCVDG
jgi:hypothetical protein